jgi:hypothetical protein
LIGRPLEGGIAKGWRPREREHLEVEFAGLVLAPILSVSGTGHEQSGDESEDGSGEESVDEDSFGEDGSAQCRPSHKIPFD